MALGIGGVALAIWLQHISCVDRDLGVFVGGLEAGGVAARSGELSLSDRILACNGADFTNMPNKK